MIGVDYDLFWTLNPKSLSPFIKAFKLRREYDSTLAWELGAYVKMAITSSFNKGSKYPTAPFGTKPKDEVTSSEEIKTKFMNHMELLNSRFK